MLRSPLLKSAAHTGQTTIVRVRYYLGNGSRPSRFPILRCSSRVVARLFRVDHDAQTLLKYLH